MSGCAAENLLSQLGFDMHNYSAEKVIASHAPESEIALQLAVMTHSLTLNSPLLPEFSGAKEAADVCRDAILNAMLEESYARYAGNTELLRTAAEKYPQLQLSVLIPASDFESVVYTTFGGSEKISHKSGAVFQYLDKINAYTTAANPQSCTVVTEVLLCEETERTYRLTFQNTLGDVVSPSYFALIIKRQDDTLYIRELKIAEK